MRTWVVGSELGFGCLLPMVEGEGGWKFMKVQIEGKDTDCGKISCKIKRNERDHFVQQRKRFRLESDDETIHRYITQDICHHHYLFTSILEIKSPPNLAISAKMASLLISALTSSSLAFTGTVE